MPARQVRPRWGRISAAGSAFLVTLVSLLGGIGLLPAGPSAAASGDSASLVDSPVVHRTLAPRATSASEPVADQPAASRPTGTAPGLDVPVASGSGKRVVFDMSDQRVWLVGADGSAVRSYLVSGSVTDNLRPGTYAVYSTSRWASGVDDSGVMQYFVRFTQGPTGAAIGFHSIPTKNGVPVQTKAQLGTAESHGCIRQDLPDAIALWNFAPVGTKVVVVA